MLQRHEDSKVHVLAKSFDSETIAGEIIQKLILKGCHSF